MRRRRQSNEVIIKESERKTEVTEGKQVTQSKSKRKIHKFITDPAYVHVTKSRTIPHPRDAYSSIKIQVGLSVPCYKEDIVKTEEIAQKLTEDMIISEMTAYGLIDNAETEKNT